MNNQGGSGYIVYFSDRRNNKNQAATKVETGEYGGEDFVNPLDGDGLPPNERLRVPEWGRAASGVVPRRSWTSF